MQGWSLEILQKEFLDFSRQNQLTVKELKEENQKLKKELANQVKILNEEDKRLSGEDKRLKNEDQRLNGEVNRLTEDRRLNIKIDVQLVPIGFIYT